MHSLSVVEATERDVQGSFIKVDQFVNGPLLRAVSSSVSSCAM